jgi:hypothetical protein
LKFKLRIDQVGPRPAAEDIIIIGGGAKQTKIALTITEQNNPLPENKVSIYDILLFKIFLVVCTLDSLLL